VVALALTRQPVSVILAFVGIVVHALRSRACLLGFFHHQLLMRMSRLLVSWRGPKAKFFPQVVLHLIEDVPHADSRIVCLTLLHSLDHNLWLNIH
jgi:hypothetical protein